MTRRAVIAGVVAAAVCGSATGAAEAPPALVAFLDGQGHVRLIRTDGTGDRILSGEVELYQTPAWFADGTSVAFSRGGYFDSRVVAVPIAGGPAERLITDAIDLDFSSDGRQLAFSSARRGTWDIWSSAADGTRPRQVTAGPAHDASPDWSPDGESIVFDSYVLGGARDIFVVGIDGTNRRRLAPHPADDCCPRWSPDGTTIVFESLRDHKKSEIYVVSPEGGAPTRITSNDSWDNNASWSDDGALIVFDSGRYGFSEIATMSPDGSRHRRITRGHSDYFAPSWQPGAD